MKLKSIIYQVHIESGGDEIPTPPPIPTPDQPPSPNPRPTPQL